MFRLFLSISKLIVVRQQRDDDSSHWNNLTMLQKLLQFVRIKSRNSIYEKETTNQKHQIGTINNNQNDDIVFSYRATLITVQRLSHINGFLWSDASCGIWIVKLNHNFVNKRSIIYFDLKIAVSENTDCCYNWIILIMRWQKQSVQQHKHFGLEHKIRFQCR